MGSTRGAVVRRRDVGIGRLGAPRTGVLRSKSRTKSAIAASSRGSSLVELLVLVAFIGLAALAGYRFFGTSVHTAATAQANCVEALSGCERGGTGSSAAPPSSGADTAAAQLAAESGGDKPWYQRAWNHVSNFFGGALVDGLWGDLKGLWGIVTDLPGTLSSLWDLGKTVFLGSPFFAAPGGIIPNPFYSPEQGERLVQLGEAIGSAVKDYFVNHTDRAIGRTVYEVVTLVVAPVKIFKAAKAKWLAKAAKTAEVVDKAADAEKVIDKAVDAEKAARLLGLTPEMEKLFAKVGRKVPTNADELAREIRYLEGETGLLTKQDADNLIRIAARERESFVDLGKQVRRRDQLAAMANRTAEQERELRILKNETGTLTQRDTDWLLHDQEPQRMQELADQIALRDALRAASKTPPKPVHIDIGGEGRYPDAINLNPNYDGLPKPTVGGLGEQAPFKSSVADLVTVESAPLRPGTITEIARIAKPGSEIRLVHPADYAAQNHQKVIDAVKGTATSTTDANGITTTVIRVP